MNDGWSKQTSSVGGRLCANTAAGAVEQGQFHQARIDDAGEQATVTGDVFVDGEQPLRLTTAVWLPPDHVYQRPSPTPR